MFCSNNATRYKENIAVPICNKIVANDTQRQTKTKQTKNFKLYSNFGTQHRSSIALVLLLANSVA